MIVGATARDIVLELIHGVSPLRRTMDVDIGIRINGWDEFEQLKTELLRTGQFNETSTSHRLVYQEVYPVDIVPFGGVSNQSDLIEWPPDQSIQMNVTGFDEALDNSIKVKIRNEPLLEMQVASLANQAALKIIAWKDRGGVNSKDAEDLGIIVKNYGPEIYSERIFEEELELMEEEEYDIVLTGAQLLGFDIARCLDSKSLLQVSEILENQTSDGLHSSLATALSPRSDYEANLILLRKLLTGISRAI